MSLEESKAVGGAIVHLTRRQKWDLLELVVAGVMSTIFFAAPVFLIRDAPPGRATPPQVTPVAAAPSPARVQIATADVTARVSTPTLQPAPRRRPSAMRRAVAVPSPALALASARPRPPLARRIARLFAGDGSHPVHPFPTVPTVRR